MCRNVEQAGSTNADVSAPGEGRGVNTQVLCLEGGFLIQIRGGI